MAVIIENKIGRRLVRLNTNDILDIVREYQRTVCGISCYDDIRNKLDDIELYLPEEL